MLSKHSQEMMLQEPMECCENSGSISGGGALMVAYNHPMYQVYLLGLGCLYLPVYDPSPSKLFSLNHKVIMVMTFLRTKSSPPNLPPRCEAHQHGTKTSVDTRLLLLRNVTFFGDGENVKRDPNSLQRLER